MTRKSVFRDSVSGDFDDGAPITAFPGAVASVFGRTGAVVAVTGDYYGAVAAALTGATQAARHVGATTSGAPVSGTFVTGDWITTLDGHIWICTSGGTPGTWQDIGGSGAVSSVAAADTSVVVTPTIGAVTVRTNTLDVIAADHPPAADWSNNSHKITAVAHGAGANEAATFDQIPTALPPNGSASGDLGGSYPSPTVAAIHETTGPTKLTIGSIPDGDYLVRSGSTLIGGSPTPGGPPTGAAGGDLGGIYPDPTVNHPGYIGVIDLLDQKTVNTAGGTFTTGAYQTRVLNTEALDTNNDCTLSSNQITLTAGTYDCYISCPAFHVNQHKARLRNVTDSVTLLVGTTEWQDATDPGTSNRSFITGRFTIAASKAIEVQHACSVTKATNGFGVQANLTEVEVYTIARFMRVS